MAAARADYRSAGAALTKVDDFETTQARRFAKERLAVLVAADPSLRNQSTGPVPQPGPERSREHPRCRRPPARARSR